MSLLDFIPKPLLAAAVALLLAATLAATFKVNSLELALSQKQTEIVLVEKAHTEAINAAIEKTNEVTTKYRAKERAMQDALDQQREKTDATISDLSKQRDALKLRLQAASATHSTGSTGSATATGLKEVAERSNVTLIPWQTDGLIDEAFRADQIRVELLGCYAAYDQARESAE